MKKVYCGIAVICLMVLFTTPVMALDATVEASADITTRLIPDTNGGGTGLTEIGLSPNVTIYYNSSDGTKFGLCGYSSKGKFEYGVLADDNNVYMENIETVTDGVSTITPITSPGADGATVITWTLMGGTGTTAAEGS